MGKRRYAQVASSSDDDEEGQQDTSPPHSPEAEEEEEEEDLEDAKPVGEVIKTSGRGRGIRRFYSSFEFDGECYHLEDSILLDPDREGKKPYVAIIKEISVDYDGSVKVMGQWFYRPEDTKKRGGGYWESSDQRELFYSFHLDEVPAESVMHKCVVHFIPSNMQVPPRREHPGFIVQKVYCLDTRRVFKLTDSDYEDDKQEEIDMLVRKTLSQLGDLPDVERDDGAVDHPDRLVSERLLQQRNIGPSDVSRDEGGVPKSVQSSKGQTSGSCPSNMSEYGAILYQYNVLTSESHRNKWLEKLLQVIQAVCTSVDGETGDKEKSRNDPDTSASVQVGITREDKSKDVVSFRWTDNAVPAVASLEREIYEVFSSDYQKYNKKMRQMTYNLKPNTLLSRRFLNGEMEPIQILKMTPNELKEGLMAEEMESTQPEEPQHLQMTDARCDRCSMKKVGLRDIIQAGRGDRYQLECTNCGHTWYASRDQAASLTVGGPTGPTSVSTAPSATTKFDDVEKALASPQRSPAKDKTVANDGATGSG